MIRIHKASEPECFPAWKKQKGHHGLPPPEPRVENNKLREALVDEQGGLCCYCGRGIDADPDPDGSHIEHFRPQARYPDLATEYGNIHASCNSKSNCGEAKGDGFDEDMCVSPMEVDEARFVYTLEGEVCPKDKGDLAATYMIEILKLNASVLVSKRKNVLTTNLPLELLRDASSDELKKMRAKYQERGRNSRCQEFRQVLTCFIDGISPHSP
jgi:uncharacterized protein (TIGR02646 family)